MVTILKRWICVLCAAICIMQLAGCADALPQMTQEEEDAIVEYAAELVRLHRKDYDSRLVDLSLYASNETSEQPEIEEPGGMDETDDTPTFDGAQQSATHTVEDLLLTEGITLLTNGYFLTDSYPGEGSDNPYFSLDAAEGMELVVMPFTLQNNTESTQSLDILSASPRFSVVINQSRTVSALSTLMMDDLSTYVGELKAGESITLVVLVEVNTETAESITSLSMTIRTATGNAVVPVL